jgi:MOSC domain-containing protein YiiM
MYEVTVTSLNIGLPRKEIFHGKEITTGIGKRPVSGAVSLGKLGFEGDAVAARLTKGEKV